MFLQHYAWKKVVGGITLLWFLYLAVNNKTLFYKIALKVSQSQITQILTWKLSRRHTSIDMNHCMNKNRKRGKEGSQKPINS